MLVKMAQNCQQNFVKFDGNLTNNNSIILIDRLFSQWWRTIKDEADFEDNIPNRYVTWNNLNGDYC